jgi:hypothetical protein
VATVTCRAGKPEVEISRPNGSRIRGDETLVVATNDFLAQGGDGLLSSTTFSADRVEILDKTVFDALAEGLAKRGAVRPDDPALRDPARPRLRLPGKWPITCGSGAPSP